MADFATLTQNIAFPASRVGFKFWHSMQPMYIYRHAEFEWNWTKNVNGCNGIWIITWWAVVSCIFSVHTAQYQYIYLLNKFKLIFCILLFLFLFVSQLPNKFVGISPHFLNMQFHYFADLLGAFVFFFVYWIRFIWHWQHCTVWKYHSEESDQPALLSFILTFSFWLWLIDWVRLNVPPNTL